MDDKLDKYWYCVKKGRSIIEESFNVAATAFIISIAIVVTFPLWLIGKLVENDE